MRVPATRAILYEFGQLKTGEVLIKWAWFLVAVTIATIFSTPHSGGLQGERKSLAC